MEPQKRYGVEPNEESNIPAVGMSEQAEELAGSVDQTMDSVAEAVQATLRRTKKSASEAMETVADGIETSTDYLSERGMAGVVEDAETLIRRYPFQTLLIGLSVGYLASWFRR